MVRKRKYNLTRSTAVLYHERNERDVRKKHAQIAHGHIVQMFQPFLAGDAPTSNSPTLNVDQSQLIAPVTRRGVLKSFKLIVQIIRILSVLDARTMTVSWLTHYEIP